MNYLRNAHGRVHVKGAKTVRQTRGKVVGPTITIVMTVKSRLDLHQKVLIACFLQSPLGSVGDGGQRCRRPIENYPCKEPCL